MIAIQLDDIVRLRRPHPCGGYLWRITRLGVDIGMVCTTCGRRVLIPRSRFNKRFKEFAERGSAGAHPDRTATDP